MSVKIRIGSRDCKFFFDSTCEKGIVLLEEKTQEQVLIKTPLDLDFSCDPTKYSLYYLANKDVRENDIFQVYPVGQDTQRIGWLFPAQAISSNNHDYFDDEHFLKYAGVAFVKAIQNINDEFYYKEIFLNRQELTFEDIFHESTCFLVLFNENLKFDPGENCQALVPSLFKYGYTRLGITNPDSLKLKGFRPSEKRLKVMPISSFAFGFEMILEILENSLAREANPLFKFFFLYQVVELLIELVYKAEQDKLIRDLEAAKDNTVELRSILNKINDRFSEKTRIKLLFSSYVDSSVNLKSLKLACHDLLGDLEVDKGNEVQEYFYSIRNFIFHQYRNFPKASAEKLDSVVNEMIDILPSILGFFKLPNSDAQ